MVYFTSDLHFFHDKEFCYKVRGFNSPEEMNETIINNVNKTVSEDDILYVLGDVYLTKEDGYKMLDRINCKRIFLIIGNHDTENKIYAMKESGKIIQSSYADIIKWGKFKFYLSHFPTLTGFMEKHLNTALINLYGHTHQTDKFFKDSDGNNIPWMYNVGVDAHNCTPVSIEEIIEDCKEEFNKYCARKDKEEKEVNDGNLCNE